MPSYTVAVPDLHGRYDLFSEVMHYIENNLPDAKVVFLGDYIDRGPNSAKIVKAVRRGVEAGNNWVALIGNHEEFMIDTLVHKDRNMRYSWLDNGGDTTLDSYRELDSNPVYDAEWLWTCPLYYKDDHRVYVHAFVDPTKSLSKQTRETLLWARYDKGEDMGWKKYHVVHGHTPRRDGPELLKNRTNLDCAAVYTGILVSGVFDDENPGGPIALIKSFKNPIGNVMTSTYINIEKEAT